MWRCLGTRSRIVSQRVVRIINHPKRPSFNDHSSHASCCWCICALPWACRVKAVYDGPKRIRVWFAFFLTYPSGLVYCVVACVVCIRLEDDRPRTILSKSYAARIPRSSCCHSRCLFTPLPPLNMILTYSRASSYMGGN